MSPTTPRQRGRFLAAALERARAGLARARSAPVRKQHARAAEQLEALLQRVETAAIEGHTHPRAIEKMTG